MASSPQIDGLRARAPVPAGPIERTSDVETATVAAGRPAQLLEYLPWHAGIALNGHDSFGVGALRWRGFVASLLP